jgi:hypothetical protein
MYRLACLLAFVTLAAAPAPAQIADTLLVWRTYGSEARAHVRVFPSDDDARPLTAVVDELAENRGGLVTDDARFLAETLGRSLGHDPAGITFVFRFSAASFTEGARPGGKTLLLRATFTRTRTGRLSPPQWRVINRAELAELTDRAFY